MAKRSTGSLASARKRNEDPRLTELTKIALALPEATRRVGGSHAQFLVRKRAFAYFLDDHHGDGIVAVTGKVLPGDNKALAEAQPRRFYLPAYIASRGWVALRLDVGQDRLGRSERTAAGQLRADRPEAPGGTGGGGGLKLVCVGTGVPPVHAERCSAAGNRHQPRGDSHPRLSMRSKAPQSLVWPAHPRRAAVSAPHKQISSHGRGRPRHTARAT